MKAIANLLFEARLLKNIPRSGFQFLGSGSESVADHSFVAAFIGYFAGTALALKCGPEIFKVTAKAIRPEYGLLTWAVIVAPVFAAIASFVPVTIAVAQDPADTLREG